MKFQLSYLGTALVGAVAAFVLLAADGGSVRADVGKSPAAGSAPATAAAARRLTPDQYRSVINDVFGEAIELGGRFEPTPRVEKLVELGASRVSVSNLGLEQYDIMARRIAEQVLAQKQAVTPCAPKVVSEPDDACARQFLAETGLLLFRRPLSQAELERHVATARVGAETLKDFYAGLSAGLAAQLVSVNFLFREETVEPDPDHRGGSRLDAYSKASRLSFFLWNAGPDRELMAAAAKGELGSKKGLAQQVDRMIASPRFEAGVRAFFSDMLRFDELSAIVKDPAIYPNFDFQVASDSGEQTLKTLVDLLVRQRKPYPEIFTSPNTFLTKELAAVYQVPVLRDVPNGSPGGWAPFEFAKDDPRKGILSQLSFVALNSHPGRSSPTLRGKALREVLLCQKIPPPPGNVKFDIVQDTSNPIYKTARARLAAHGANPACAGCHKIMDPIGLAFESFDGGGGYRTTENGVNIDTSGELNGKTFQNASELAKIVSEDPRASACLVERIIPYGLGRTVDQSETAWANDLVAIFAKDDKYVLPDFMRRVAKSSEFYRVSMAE